ncbi:fad monooxygenase [Colletotrichum incanum]|uniref:Fad monooxygenase n=1 Tax=Colletotrichum incanum TaxID=1573173 RepID=A0A161Y4I1_COLIC|nr:fad monooxygenase [Colletotrichum incanum]
MSPKWPEKHSYSPISETNSAQQRSEAASQLRSFLKSRDVPPRIPVPPRPERDTLTAQAVGEVWLPLLQKALHPFDVVSRPGELHKDPRVQDVRALGTRRTVRHHVAHQLRADQRRVLGEVLRQVDRVPHRLLRRRQELGKEAADQRVRNGVDIARGRDVARLRQPDQAREEEGAAGLEGQAAAGERDPAPRPLPGHAYGGRQRHREADADGGAVDGDDGMGVSYDGTGSPLIHESSRGIWTAGRRCPDVSLTPASDEEPKRLYDLVSSKYGKHLVLKIGRRSNGPALSGGLQELVRLFNVVPHQAEPRRTGVDGSPATDSFYTADWAADDDDFTVVVRPDMYIGYVGQGDGWRDYLSYLTQS